MANEFYADPNSMTRAFFHLRICRDLNLAPPADSASDYFKELVPLLGFPDVQRAFQAHMNAVQDFFARAYACVDDLFRASVAAAVLYERTDAEIVRFVLKEPWQ